MESLLIFVNIALAVILVIVILLQRSEGGALGLGVSQDNFTSARSMGTFLTKFTSIIAALFIICSIAIVAISRDEYRETQSVLEKEEASAVEENTNNKNINSGTIKREDVKVGRNEIISITNGTETKEMKYKKAKPLIDSGEWRIS